MKAQSNSQGLRTFGIIWFGQLISLLGSGLTSFALGVWVYQETGSTTQFALVALFTAVPGVILSPFAGIVVDRWDRRLIMLLSDLGAGLSTAFIAVLFFSGQLNVWHIYLATAVNASFSSFQWPAYVAATSLLVPKKHLGRANGLLQMSEALPFLVAPILAGILMVTIQIQGILVIDFVTFGLALISLAIVRVPTPEQTAAGAAGEGSFLYRLTYGWRYIAVRPGLLALLFILTLNSFLISVVEVLGTPMILAFAEPDVLGIILSLGGSGILVGTVVMSAWGGPSRRIHGVLGFQFLTGIGIFLAGVRESAVLLTFASFLVMFTFPFISGSNRAIWQSKIEPDIQGRVFSARRATTWLARPFAYLLSGTLADNIFTPLLLADGPLANTIIGQIIGIGPGRGIGLILVIFGLLTMLVAVLGYLYPRVRLIEDELPDIVIHGDEKRNGEREKT